MNQNTNKEVFTTIDNEALYEKLLDAETPGLEVMFCPNEATRAGAFIEDALSEYDAQESSFEVAHPMTKATHIKSGIHYE